MIGDCSMIFDNSAPFAMSALGTMVKVRESSNLMFLASVVAVAFHVLMWIVGRLLGRNCLWRERHKAFEDFRCCVSAMKFSCCPKRKTRWFQCSKKRWNHQRKECGSSDTEFSICRMTCPLQRAAACYKLHLPPPLPCKQRRSKRTKSSESAQEESKATSQPGESKVSPISPPVQRQASLIDLARMQQWKAILAQPIRRRDARNRDADGLYPLHWAVSGGPPVEVVQALLEAYPSAVRKRDSEGSTPLHFASCYSASNAVHNALLKLYPEAATTPDRYGRVPLYHAVEKSAGRSVLETLVQAAPNMILKPCTPTPHEGKVTRVLATRTPLFIAWANLDRHAKQSFKGRHWEKACFLTEAAFCQRKTGTFKLPDQSSFNILSTVIALDMYLPEAVFDLAMASSPGQVYVKDLRSGHYPLHVAAASHVHSSQRTRVLLERLLEANRTCAVERDALGFSPLALALDSGKSWEMIQPLFLAAPEVLTWRDAVTNLPPVLLAASAQDRATTMATESSAANVDPCGLLTRKQHELLRGVVASGSGGTKAEGDPETEHTDTIFALLQADPSCIQ